MANVINAITTGLGGLSTTADASGIINLQSGGTTVATVSSTGLNVTGALTVSGSPINVSGGGSIVSQGTSLTLTSASNRVQVVTLTTTGLSVILPDATTLSAGGPTFIIVNSGTNTFTIKQNGGIVLVTLTSGQSVMLEVYDIATAAGIWLTSNLDVASPQAVANFTSVAIDGTNAAYPYAGGDGSSFNGNPTAGSFVDCLKLTSTTALLVWTRNGNKSVYGVVATNTAGVLSFGTIVQIYDGSAGGTAAVISAAAMLLSGLTTGMVFIGRSATAVAVPFSISGSTITVGTVSSNFGNKPTYNNIVHSVCVLSSTVMMIVYNDATFTEIRVATMTYNGASAPTLGTPTAGIAVRGHSGLAPSGTLLTLTSTTAQLWYSVTATTIATRVVTSNGASAPTLGTAITATVPSYNYGAYCDMRNEPYAYSATETSIIWQYDFQQAPNVASYTISGTTVTQTSAPAIMVNPNSIGMPSRIEWVTSTTGLFFQSYANVTYGRYTSLSKIYKVGYTPSGGTIIYSNVGTIPDSSVYSYLAGMCLLSSTTGIVAGYNLSTGYISANVFTVL